MAISDKVKGYVSATRPEIALMDITLPAGSALAASFAISGNLPRVLLLFLVVLGAYCATVSSYVANDVCDVDIDRVNLPGRAIPSGILQRTEAFFFSMLLFGLSLMIFFAINLYSGLTVILAFCLIAFYSAVLKRRTFLSFVPVGLAYGLVPIGVWFAIRDPENRAFGIAPVILLLGLMICITDWGFTLSGVCRDVRGDRERGAPTVPVRFGIPFTARLVFFFWLAGVLLSFTIWHASGFGWLSLYLAASLLGGGWMLYLSLLFVRNPKPEIGGALFLKASRYRGFLFLGMIGDIVLRCV